MQTYSKRNVIVTYGPITLTKGVPDNDESSIRVQPPEGETTVTTAMATVVGNLLTNQTGTVEIDLVAQAPENEMLSAICAKQRELGQVQPHELQVKDFAGKELHFSGEALIQQKPSAEFGGEAGIRTWSFICPRLTNNYGGGQDV